MNDVRLIAFYLPQFHPIPENDGWWGKGFTEWSNVSSANPVFPGHYQPHIPADLGYYDLRLSEVREEQARLAKDHGIFGFCYYYYHFTGKRLLNRPLDEVLASGKPDFPFCVCWANENWTRRWDGHDEEILIEQVHSDQDDRDFIQQLLPTLQDKRYIRVQNKLLLLIYRAELFKDPRKTAAVWRKIVKKEIGEELYLCAVNNFVKDINPEQIGFDGTVQFPIDFDPSCNLNKWQFAAVHNINYEEVKDNWFINYPSVVNRMVHLAKPTYNFFRGVFPSWDNTPRRKKAGSIFVNSSPEFYKLFLRTIIGLTCEEHQADERIIFINAWNEWAEGAHLEPDKKYGSRYLEVTLEALKEENNVKLLQEEIKGKDELVKASFSSAFQLYEKIVTSQNKISELERINDQLNSTFESQVTLMKQELATKDQKVEQLLQIIGEKDSTIIHRDRLVQEKEVHLSEKEKLIQEKEGLLQKKEQLVLETDDRLKESREEIVAFSERYNSLDQKYLQSETRLAMAVDNLDTLKIRLNEQEKDILQHEEKLREQKESIRERDIKVSGLLENIRGKDSLIENLQIDNVVLGKRILENKEAMSARDEQVEILSSALREVEQRVAEAEETGLSLKERISFLEHEVFRNEQKIDEQNSQIDKQSAFITILKADMRRLELSNWAYANSYSWKITRPLRWLHPQFFKLFYFFFPFQSRRWVFVKKTSDYLYGKLFRHAETPVPLKDEQPDFTESAMQTFGPGMEVKVTDGFKLNSILFIGHDAMLAGAPVLLLSLIRWFAKNTGIKISIILLRGGALLNKYRELAPVLVWEEVINSCPDSHKRRTWLAEFSGGADIIYGNTAVVPGIYDELTWSGVPFITHVHELEKSIKQYIPVTTIEKMHLFSTGYIAGSKPVSVNLIENHFVQQRNIVVINDFIETREINSGLSKKEMRRSLGLKEEGLIVLGCGTIYWRKGVDLFIETALILRNQGLKNFHFYWIGENIWNIDPVSREMCSWEHLDERIKEEGLRDYITFLGEKENFFDYFLAGDIFYLPSLEDPFPLVCLEAAQAGLPIICFENAGGIPDFVEHDAGFIVPMKDTGLAAKKIAWLEKHRHSMVGLGAKARNKFLERHTVDIAAPHILSFCRKIGRLHSADPATTSSRERKRIVFVTTNDWSSNGGSEQLWRETAIEARRRGHQVMVVIKRWDPEPFFVRDFETLEIITTYKENEYFDQVRSFDPNLVVISVGDQDTGTEWYEFCQHYNFPYAIINQLTKEPEYCPIRSELTQRLIKGHLGAETVFFTGKDNHEVMERRLGCKIPNGGICYNPYDVDRSVVLPFPSLQQGLKIAIVGNLSRVHKGTHLALELMKMKKWRDRNIHISIYGRGADEEILRKLASDSKLKNVTFHGHTERILEIWKENHAIMMPSFMEGLPLVLVGAMIAARVPIVTDIGAHREVISDNKSGFLAKKPTAESLDEALERAYQASDNWEQIGQEARRSILEKLPEDPIDYFIRQLIPLARKGTEF